MIKNGTQDGFVKGLFSIINGSRLLNSKICVICFERKQIGT